MKATAVLLVILSVICFSAAEPNCDNPFYDGSNAIGPFLRLRYLLAPEQQPKANTICGDLFTDGDEQCCDESTYDLIQEVWDDIRLEIDATVAEARTLRAEFETLRDEWRPIRNAIADNDDLTQDEKDRLIQLIEDVLDAYDRFIDGLITLWADCASAILRYWVGILCLGCHPLWEDYIYQVNVDGEMRWRILFDNERCEDIRGGCGGYFDLYFDLINDLIDAYSDFANFEFDEIENPCGESCEEYICDWLVAGSTLDNAAVDSPTTDTTKRDLAYEQIRMHLGENAHYLDALQGLHQRTNRMAGSLKRQTDARDDRNFGRNTYGTDGYKFNSGKSSLDTEVDSAATLGSWLNFLW